MTNCGTRDPTRRWRCWGRQRSTPDDVSVACAVTGRGPRWPATRACDADIYTYTYIDIHKYIYIYICMSAYVSGFACPRCWPSWPSTGFCVRHTVVIWGRPLSSPAPPPPRRVTRPAICHCNLLPLTAWGACVIHRCQEIHGLSWGVHTVGVQHG